LSKEPEDIFKTTCPRDCYDGCGIVVTKRDGKISQVKGNPDHPSNKGRLCGKCSVAYNSVWQDETARLLYPMRRIGKKGSGEFERISWQEALDEVAANLHNIRATDGAKKIFHTHYTGTCSLIANEFPGRLFDHLGATEVDPDTICNKAGHVALDYVFGDSLNGFDPRTAKDSVCIVVWGANPSASAPHVDKHWLHGSNAKVIVIDPVRHETAKNADLYLQLRPGTDAALAFTMAHIMQRDNLLDTAYIRDHVLGFDDIAPTISQCTPAWGEEQTGVPCSLIEQAAHLYSSGPSLLWLGQGLQRQPSGGNIFRACVMLPSFSGNIGKPGAGIYYLNDIYAIGSRRGKSPEFDSVEETSSKHTVSQMDIPALLQDPAAVRAYVVWNCNPVASNPAQNDIKLGLSRNDLFTVVVDCFQTDTADYADIVLPAASFLEFDDLCASYFQFTIGPQVKCSEPMGEALPNQEIFRRLASAMDFTASELFEDDQAIINTALEECGAGVNWEELKEKAWAYVCDETVVLWEDGTFATPSGKIEIASLRAKIDGLPYVPLPNIDPVPIDESLRLLSPADKNLMNSSYGNDMRIHNLIASAKLTVHPEDAAHRGIHDGDEVVLSNRFGELTLTANIEDIIPRGTLLTHKSRWPKFEPTGANVNILHNPVKTDMGQSTSVHGTQVFLRKVERI
jgi:anaerobic selenocysteine-containing dehydrogenase